MEENKNIEMHAETPSFVYRDGMTTNIEYVEWLLEVKATKLVAKLEMPEKFGVVPWKHHAYIMSKSKTLVEWPLQDIYQIAHKYD